jgi:hypothetical protein
VRPPRFYSNRPRKNVVRFKTSVGRFANAINARKPGQLSEVALTSPRKKSVRSSKPSLASTIRRRTSTLATGLARSPSSAAAQNNRRPGNACGLTRPTLRLDRSDTFSAARWGNVCSRTYLISGSQDRPTGQIRHRSICATRSRRLNGERQARGAGARRALLILRIARPNSEARAIWDQGFDQTAKFHIPPSAGSADTHGVR